MISKKNSSYIVVLLVILLGCQRALDKVEDNSYLFIFPFKDSTGLYGYMNNKGETIVEPQFKHANYFTEGIASVVKDSLYGYIKLNGEWKIKPTFRHAKPFFNGYAIVDLTDSMGISKEYLISKQGNVVYEKPKSLRKVLKGGLFVCLENGNSIILNTLGDTVKVVREGVLYASTKENMFFYTDSGMVQLHISTNNLKPLDSFDYIGPFSDGIATAIKNGKNIVIDENLATVFVIPPEHRGLDECKESRIGFSKDKNNRVYSGFLNEKGEVVIPPIYRSVLFFSEGVAGASIQSSKGEVWGFIDTLGKWCVEPQFDEIWDSYCNGLAIVKKDGDWGYVNKQGIWVKRCKLGEKWEDVIATSRFDYLYSTTCNCRF